MSAKKRNSRRRRQSRARRRRRRHGGPAPRAEATSAHPWYVPFREGQAILYHDHEDPNDHRRCGPYIFCCPNAAHVLRTRLPDAIPDDCTWEFTDSEDLVDWLDDAAVKRFYFVYCDVADCDRIHFVGVDAESVPAVLRHEISLHSLNHVADSIDTVPRLDGATIPMHARERKTLLDSYWRVDESCGSLPEPSVSFPASEVPAEDWTEADVRGIVTNPVCTGIGPFTPYVTDEQWVAAAKRRIVEIGPDQFFVDLLCVLRKAFPRN